MSTQNEIDQTCRTARLQERARILRSSAIPWPKAAKSQPRELAATGLELAPVLKILEAMPQRDPYGQLDDGERVIAGRPATRMMC